MLASGRIKLPQLNSNEIDTICEKMIKILDDEDKLKVLMQKSIKIIEESKQEHKRQYGPLRNRDLVRRKTFKQQVKRQIEIEFKNR